MTDTVTRLLALADGWADQCGGCDSSHLAAHSKHRAALEAELRKLFTPLSSYTIGDHVHGLDPDTREDLCAFSFKSGARWAEKQHGIGGES